jgi:hypothetical protein
LPYCTKLLQNSQQDTLLSARQHLKLQQHCCSKPRQQQVMHAAGGQMTWLTSPFRSSSSAFATPAAAPVASKPLPTSRRRET